MENLTARKSAKSAKCKKTHDGTNVEITTNDPFS